jgi:protease-4
MRRFIVGFFAVIGGLVVVLLLAGIGLGLWFRATGPSIAGNTVLTLDIGSGFPDVPPSGALSSLIFPGRPPLRDVLDALERAGNDPRVSGLVARFGGGEMGTAQAQELRDAVAAFRAKGKRAVAYADSFGEFSSGTRSYYLAASFDQIWLQPMGLVGLVGLRVEEPFFHGTLDKLGIVPRFDHREEYKSAADPLTQNAMTAPDREQIEALLNSVYGQIVQGIAAGRKLDEATVRWLADHGPLLAQDALAAHLIDHIGYSDDALASLGVRQPESRRLMPLARYLAAVGHPHTNGPTIALIYASGLIQRGRDDASPLADSGTLGADGLVQAFRMAERDPDVRAILFRVDSPGGSATASESIWRATVQAKAAGKKLIVSMGNVAGSGGYYVAAAADKIVAEPATLTGSIGVVGGKVLISGLLDKIGAGTSAVQVGDSAGLFSAFEDFTPDGYRRFEAFLDDVYAGFKDRVAEGRKLDPAAVEALAKGRIWSGEDAKSRGLVDALGGYATALALAKSQAGIAADSEVYVELFPPPRDAASQLIARVLGDDSDTDDARALTHAVATLRPIITQFERLSAPPGALTMAPVEIH